MVEYSKMTNNEWRVVARFLCNLQHEVQFGTNLRMVTTIPIRNIEGKFYWTQENSLEDLCWNALIVKMLNQSEIEIVRYSGQQTEGIEFK